MRYVFSLSLILFSFFCAFHLQVHDFDYDDVEHLSFKGIPITGSSEDMLQQLRRKGCTYSGADRVKTQDGDEYRIDYLRGTLIGYNNLIMSVWSTLGATNVVFQCEAAFPVTATNMPDNWDQIVETYNTVFTKLGRKYGTPTQVNHYCPGEDGFLTTESGQKYRNLKRGEVDWHDTWKTAFGEVTLAVEYQVKFAVDANSKVEDQYGVTINWFNASSFKQGKAS